MKIIFVAKPEFPEPANVGGGYGERVLGLYIGYLKRFGGFYYSISKRLLYNQTGMPLYAINPFRFAISMCRERIALVLAYPTALHLFYLFPLLALFRAVGLIRIVIDVHDLPIEQRQAFSDSSEAFVDIPLRIGDLIVFRLLADAIITVSPSYKAYVASKYKVDKGTISVLSNSSFPELFTVSPTPKTYPIRVLYLGTIMETKGSLRLVDVLRETRKKLDLELIMLGYSYLDLPREQWITVSKVPFDQIPSICQSATVCILPLDPEYLHYQITRPIKLLDYLAAARTVVTTNVYESAKIISDANAGVVVNCLEDLKEALPELVSDFSNLDKFGLNGRKIIEYELNWGKQNEELRLLISNL